MAIGVKTGGRKAGTPNKASQRQRALAARVLDEARASGRQLGIEVLDEMMNIAKGATASYQKVSASQAVLERAAGHVDVVEQPGDMEKFGQWWDRTVHAAKELAKYQSPTYRAIAVVAPGAKEGQGQAPAQIEASSAGAVDRAAQTYLRLVKA